MVAALLGGSATVWNLLAGGKVSVSALASVSTVVIAALGWIKFRAEAARESEAAEPPLDITACVFTICEIVRNLKSISDDRKWALRGTLHTPAEGPGTLVQRINYHGGDNDGQDRTLPAHCGVTGLAYTEKSPRVFQRKGQNTDEFHRELMATYHFSPQAVVQLRQDRQSACAVPIYGVDKVEVVGVLYFDSDEHDFFDSDVQQVILFGCQGVSRYISQARSG